MPRTAVEAGRTLLVLGPASVTLIEGEASILESPLTQGERVVVLKGRQIPVETLSQSFFELNQGAGSEVQVVEGSTIPNSWREASEAVLEAGGRVVVIGGVDAGKSTFCTYLINSSIKAGLETALVDADVGQADVGPPATISLASAKKHVRALTSLRAEALIFVGHISPGPIVERVISGIARLKAKISSSAKQSIVNTDGWIEGEQAVAYKMRIVDEVSPDLVIGIGENGKLDPILNRVKTPSLTVQCPTAVRRRSREERKQLREFGYRRYLQKTKVGYLHFDRLKSMSFEAGETGLTRKKTFDVGGLREMVNSMLGFLDEDGWLLGIGILLDADAGRRVIKVSTPIQLEDVRGIEVGAVKLAEDGRELAYMAEPNTG